MKKILILSFMVLSMSTTMSAQRKTNIDADWKFHLGEGSKALTDVTLTSDWRSLDLPHDWSVEHEAAKAADTSAIGPFTQKSIGGHQTGFTVGGEGWYYKEIDFNKKTLKEFRHELYIEGAYNHSEVYVNGKKLNENMYGYMSYRTDISKNLQEGKNHIIIHVVNEGNNSRWYAGSGLYRHVWLVKTPLVYADEWDTFIEAHGNDVKISTNVYNQTVLPSDIKLIIALLDPKGRKVGSTVQKVTIPADGKTPIQAMIHLNEIEKWSLSHPSLYTAVLTVTGPNIRKNNIVKKHFGIRSIEFSAEKGFLLNGEPTLLKGGCVHHDNGLLGASAYDRAETRKLEILKAQGYNAVRCSHNLPSEHFLDACDSLGIMVIDEAFDQWNFKKNDDDYHNFFKEHSTEDVKRMVLRDRNHPSIIMWSIGNEIPGRIEPEGIAAAERLSKTVKSLDTSRPVTAAICSWDEGEVWTSNFQNWDTQDEKAFKSLDVGGYNYLFGKYEHDHGTHPNRVMCGTESFPKQASQNWDIVERLPYVIGDFVWTAVDYLGEAGIGSSSIRNEGQQSFFQSWPWFNGWCGDIDLIGEKKPQSYYRDVVWRQRPITMAVEDYIPEGYYQSVSLWGWQVENQNWTFPTLKEGSELNVNVYSRSPRVRLYLNNEIVGDNETNDTYTATFKVPYRAGKLRAINLNSEGNEIAGEEYTLETTGSPKSIHLRTDRNEIHSDGSDLSYVTIELVDEADRVVISDSNTIVNIKVEGNGTLLASGNGSPTDIYSFRNPNPKVYKGRALAIVKSSRMAGTIKVTVESDGLGKSETTILTR